MPEVPSIVPLILAGILVGSILRSTRAHISWRFMIVGSLLGGLGNVANAAALLFFQNPETRQPIPSSLRTSQLIPTQTTFFLTPFSFLILSFIVGAIMVLLVFIVAVVTLRIRGRVVLEE